MIPRHTPAEARATMTPQVALAVRPSGRGASEIPPERRSEIRRLEAENASLVDRLSQLRVALERLLADDAAARREVRFLRQENRRLRSQLSAGVDLLTPLDQRIADGR